MLIIEILKKKPQNHFRIIFSLLEANPGILPSPNHSLVAMTIFSILHQHHNHVESEFTNTILHLYHFEVTEVSKLDEIIEKIISHMNDSKILTNDSLIFEGTDFDAILALELICSQKEWIWVYSEIIIAKLWGFMKPPTTAFEMRRVAMVFAMISRLGKFGVLQGSEQSVSELRKRLIVVLSSSKH
jgi:hypothetical protein